MDFQSKRSTTDSFDTTDSPQIYYDLCTFYITTDFNSESTYLKPTNSRLPDIL